MVPLTRLDGSELWLNVSAIVSIEGSGTTVIRLRDGETVRVKEKADVVAGRVADVRADVVARGVARAFKDAAVDGTAGDLLPTPAE